MEIYLLGQCQLVPIFVFVVGHSGRNTEWVFCVFFKIYLFFCFPLRTGLQGWGCMCTTLPYFHNAREVLEVVTWIQEGGPKSRRAHGMLQECCLVPGHWGVLGGAGNEPYC